MLLQYLMCKTFIWIDAKKTQHKLSLLWCGAGLNRRHKDFQSFALPTELPHPACRRQTPFPLFSERIAKIGDFDDFGNYGKD